MVDARKPSWELPSSTPAVRTSWRGWGRYPRSHHATYRSVSRRKGCFSKEDRKEEKACGWLLQLSYVSALKKTSCSQRPTMRKTFLPAHWLDALNGKISCQQMPQPTKSSREGTKWKKGRGRRGGVWSNGSEGYTMDNRKQEKGRHLTIMRAIEGKGKTPMCNVCQGQCHNHLTPSRQMGKTKAQEGSNKVDG